MIFLYNMEIDFSSLIKRSFKDASIYLPIEEAIVNSIHAIQDYWNLDEWIIKVKILRETQQLQLLETKNKKNPSVIWFEIEDNWIGFTEDNKKSFARIFSWYKKEKWWIWFWRVSYLKFFNNVKFLSYCKENWDIYKKSWQFVPTDEVFSNYKEEKVNEDKHWTKLILKDIASSWFPEVDFDTIVRKIIERLLWFYVSGQKLPEIEFIDSDWNKIIKFSEYLESTQKISLIKTKQLDTINIKWINFKIKLVKVYQTQLTNGINLCWHNRIVQRFWFKQIIPLFDDCFYDKDDRYVVLVFISSDYLDERVNSERSSFDYFPKTENETNNSILWNWTLISSEWLLLSVKDYLTKALEKDYRTRKEYRDNKINDFYKENPYYKDLKEKVNYDKLPQDFEPVQIEKEISEVIFNMKIRTREQVKKITEKEEQPVLSQIDNEINEIIDNISLIQKTELAKYVLWRKLVIDLMEKSLKYDQNTWFKKEEELHQVLFPRYKNSNNSKYDENSLRLIDEKLNYEKFICSENFLEKNKGKSRKNDRLDIWVFSEIVAFRWGDNVCTPITVFELKRPWRKEFINESEKEDPINQIIRYLNWIKDWTYKPKDLVELDVNNETPAYWYLICSIDKDVEKRLTDIKWFNPLPDNQWFIRFNNNTNTIIQAISWKKLIQDAKNRNKIFFEKLWINNK